MSGRLSIKTISELSGVSVATVSRVMNQNGRFSLETERRVKDVIAKQGYVPSAVARGLRTKTLPIIGIIVPDIANEFFAKIVLEMQLLLFSRGYSVIICNTNESEELERMHLTTLGAQNVSGLVYISGGHRDEEFSSNVPAIYIDRHPEGEQAACSVLITSDNERGGYLAVNELIRCGCGRIALLIDKHGHSSRTERLNGYMRAIREHGLSADNVIFAEVSSVGYQDAYEAMLQLWRGGRSFDGVACGTDWLAIGALAALREMDVPVPGSVQVVGFDDITAAMIHAVPVTTIRQDTKAMAEVAVEQMMRLVAGQPTEQRHWFLPVELIRRATTRARREADE